MVFSVYLVGIINISFTILVVFESRGLKKNLYSFPNNMYPKDTVIINLVIISGEYDLFIKMHGFNDNLEI